MSNRQTFKLIYNDGMTAVKVEDISIVRPNGDEYSIMDAMMNKDKVSNLKVDILEVRPFRGFIYVTAYRRIFIFARKRVKSLLISPYAYDVLKVYYEAELEPDTQKEGEKVESNN